METKNIKLEDYKLEDFLAFEPESPTPFDKRKKTFYNIQRKIKRRKTNKLLFTSTGILSLFLILGVFIWKHSSFNRQTFINSEKQVKNFNLPDGSIVELEPNSSITYSKSEFNKIKRAIELKGTAIFKVSKNKHKPFIVSTSKMNVEALGTIFKVSESVDQKKSFVFLYEGKISVTQNKKIKIISASNSKESEVKKTILKPKEGYVLNENLKPISSYVSAANENKLTLPKEIAKFGYNMAQLTKLDNKQNKAFFKEKLYFSNTQLTDVYKSLSIIYHKDIVFPKEVTDQIYFTGNIFTKIPLEKNLLSLSQMNDLNAYQKENFIIIEKNKL